VTAEPRVERLIDGMRGAGERAADPGEIKILFGRQVLDVFDQVRKQCADAGVRRCRRLLCFGVLFLWFLGGFLRRGCLFVRFLPAYARLRIWRATARLADALRRRLCLRDRIGRRGRLYGIWKYAQTERQGDCQQHAGQYPTTVPQGPSTPSARILVGRHLGWSSQLANESTIAASEAKR
jgi:hypothetical protein